MNQYVAKDSVLIENLNKKYAAVSTELLTGREVWHSEDAIIKAVRASISLPGLFPAINNNDRWLVDGGLVNPVPVSVCKALGADIVIAVNLNGDIVGKHIDKKVQTSKSVKGFTHKMTDLVKEYTGSLLPITDDDIQPPGLFDAIAGSINIIQDRITRSRLAGNPADIVLTPKLSHIGLIEFHRASEAINEGEKCVQMMLPVIKDELDIF